MDSYYTHTMLKTIGCLLKFFYRLDYIDNFATSERVTLGDYNFNDLIYIQTHWHISAKKPHQNDFLPELVILAVLFCMLLPLA